MHPHEPALPRIFCRQGAHRSHPCNAPPKTGVVRSVMTVCTTQGYWTSGQNGLVDVGDELTVTDLQKWKKIGERR